MQVSMRGGFSDRNSIKPENTQIQLKDFDKRTRIQLHNMITEQYVRVFGRFSYCDDELQDFLRFVKGTVYSQPLDANFFYDDSLILKQIEYTILKESYDNVLTIIEALIQYWDNYLKENKICNYYDLYTKKYIDQSLFDVANKCFEHEYVGYRFINRIIMPISDEIEVKTIEETLKSPFQPVYEHISKANKLLADRVHPDYENSIKESISAVEAIGEVITGNTGKDTTLSNLLNTMESKGVMIHGSLKSAFKTLYGYTCDANGIRHAGNIGGPSSTFEEAKFMLVACCAFINYLTSLCSD